jgi:hypothetical protein
VPGRSSCATCLATFFLCTRLMAAWIAPSTGRVICRPTAW